MRLIFHKSFPLGRSINSLTPRHDIKTHFPPGTFKYFCLAMFISMVAAAGRGSFLTQFDAQDAYKQLQVRDEDLNQQVFSADGQFWVDFCASFGALYGNDIYSAFGNAHCICLAVAAAVPLLRVYVDNYINITPYQGLGTERIAQAEAERIRRELIESGLKFHQFQSPSQIIEFLGVLINTREMTVAITKDRLQFMREHIKEWREKASYTLKELCSLIGLLLFVSQIVICMKSATSWLLHKKTNMVRSTSTVSRSSKKLNLTLDRLDYILERWNGKANIYDMCWSKGPDLTIYCDAAIDKSFPKAGSFGKGALRCLRVKKFLPRGQKRRQQKASA